MADRPLSWGAAVLAVVTASTPGTSLAEYVPEGTASYAAASTPRLSVTITATRNPVKTFEYPGMVSVIGGEEILRRQASTPDDLLQFVPNVEFTGGPRRTGEVPSIRGFSGPDVIVTFDGARQNFGSAHDGRFFIDPGLLRQVEVLRGPASSLYGSGGTGGVIELRTVNAADLLAPDQTIGLDVAAGNQTVNNDSAATITAYGKPRPAVDLLASVTKRDSDDIDLGGGGTLRPSEDDILAALLKAGFALSTHQSLETAFTGFSNDAREPNNGQGLGDDARADKQIRSGTWRATYEYVNPQSRFPDLDLTVYHTESEADERRLDDLGNGPLGELLRRDVDTTGLRLDARARLLSTDTFNALLTYGGEAYRDEQNGAAGAGERDGVPDAESDFYGLFLQAELEFSDPSRTLPGHFLVIPGVRYDDYETESDLGGDNGDDELSPRLSISYLPTEGSMLFASYAEAFRAPTFDELYLTGNHFVIPLGPGTNVINRFVANPNLQP
ncbi:MAG: TonB-dependent receptor, partial [Pseudomonadota bacterium]|nr:TonB-dependent receptor [Pseudomonadota bacterium]